MKISINCPNCNEKIEIEILKKKVVSVKIDTTFYVSEKEISNALQEHGIEFG